MKKKKSKLSPAFMQTLLPHKEKDILEIAKDPKKMKAVIELGRAANEVSLRITKSSTMDEWVDKVAALLPDFITDKEDFLLKFKEFTNDYYNKQKGNDTASSI